MLVGGDDNEDDQFESIELRTGQVSSDRRMWKITWTTHWLHITIVWIQL